jgi:hypothetical protein
MSKLPDSIVQDLNVVGLGGRLVYVPLLKKKKISDEIYEAMISTLKVGKSINLDDFQNMVSLRTLYRIKTKAIEEFERLKEKGGHGNESEQSNCGG